MPLPPSLAKTTSQDVLSIHRTSTRRDHACYHIPSIPAMDAVPHLQVLIIRLLAVAAVLRQAASAPPTSSYRCGWCPRSSTASLLPPDAAAGLGSGACGYGEPAAAEIAAAEGGLHVAAVSAGLFRDGQACGACYQLRCRGRAACAQDGVKVVVVADVPGTNRTGAGGGNGRFLLTKDAFAAMMITPNDGAMSAHHDDDLLVASVDVDFRRIPCAYRDKQNLSVRVEETSVRSRGRLALRFLYQGGQTEIAAVEVSQQAVIGDAAQSPASMWRYMTRRQGSPGVWRTSRAPPGPLRLRIVITAGSGGKWLQSDGAVLPAGWVPGGVYDTGLKIADVAASTCGGASCAFAEGDDEDGDEELR